MEAYFVNIFKALNIMILEINAVEKGMDELQRNYIFKLKSNM